MDGLKAALAGLRYPLFFMDFETVNPAIPRFAGMRPYDHLPFQWSVHLLEELAAAPEHFEFLATDGSDPRCEFIDSLCDALGESGSIVVYNAGFESQRLCRACHMAAGIRWDELSKFRIACGTCFPLFGTMSTTPRSRGRTR